VLILLPYISLTSETGVAIMYSMLCVLIPSKYYIKFVVGYVSVDKKKKFVIILFLSRILCHSTSGCHNVYLNFLISDIFCIIKDNVTRNFLSLIKVFSSIDVLFLL
jgi:hypothetical protein